MSLTRRVAHNTFIQLTGKAASVLLGVIAIAIITRYLGQTGFGEYTIITAFLQTAIVLVDMGLALMMVQMISKPNANEQKLISNFLSLRLISSFILLALAVIIAFLIPSYSQTVKLGIAIVAISYLFSATSNLLAGVFQKNLHLEYVAIAEVLGRFILLAITLFAIFEKWPLYSLLVAMIIGNSINLALLFFFSKKFVKINLKVNLQIDFNAWKTILRQTWPIALSIAFNLVYFKADTIILSLTRSRAEVGIYGATYKVLEITILFSTAFITLILPILTKAWAEKNLEHFKNALQKSFDLLVLTAVPMFFGALFLADRLMTLIAGKEFVSAGPVLKILTFATAIMFAGGLFTHIIIALDKQKQMLKYYIITAVVGLTGYLIFIPRYSYYGAAYMTIAAELIIALPAYFIVTRATKITPNFSIILKSLAAAVIMSIPLYFLKSWNLFLLVIIAVATYFLALYLFRGISREMIKEIVKLKE